MAGHRLRPTFTALVAVEAELGPLFAIVERAAEGRLSLTEMVALFWHCRTQDDLRREVFADAIVAGGLSAATPALRIVLSQILQGR